jgi:hypothetical protein
MAAPPEPNHHTVNAVTKGPMCFSAEGIKIWFPVLPRRPILHRIAINFCNGQAARRLIRLGRLI